MNFEIPSVNQKQGILHSVKSRLATLLASQVQGTKAGSGDAKRGVASAAPSALAAQVEVFSNLMETALQIARHDVRGLASLVSAILRPLQFEQILSVAEREQHAAREAIRFEQLFSSDYFFSYFDPNDCIRLTAGDYEVDLARDIVLTTPWVRNGFASALAHIGEGKKSGHWQQDPNHSVMLVLPWRIAVVTGGNHSIAAGILSHEGSVVPSDVLDLTPVLARVFCDGRRFLCRTSGKAVAHVRDGRMGALFEIGRLMTQMSSRQSGSPAPTLE